MSGYRVEEAAGRVRFVLPWRRPIKAAKDVKTEAGCMIFVGCIAMGLTLVSGSTILLWVDRPSGEHLLMVAFVAAPLALLGLPGIWLLGWYLLGARTVIELLSTA